MKKPPSLREQILKKVVPGVLVALLLITCASRWATVQLIRTQVSHRLQQASEFKAERIVHDLETLQSSVHAIASNDLIENSIVNPAQRAEAIPQFFRSLQLPNIAFRRITMTDYKGRPLVSNRNAEHIDIREFIDAVSNGSEILDISKDRILVVLPIRLESKPNASTEGAIAVEFDTVKFLSRLRSSLDTQRFQVFYDEQLLYSDALPNEASNDREWISSLAHAGDFPTLLVEQSETSDEAFSHLRPMDTFLLCVFAISAISVVAAILFASQIMVSPLDTLNQQIKQIESKNDLSHHVAVSGPEEFQTLTESFNRMISALSETTVSRDDLLETKDQLELALAGGNIGLWVWDVYFNNVIVSKELSAQVGSEVAYDSYESFLERIHPNDREATKNHIEKVFANLTANFEATFRLRHEDGGYRWILSRGRVVLGADAEPVKMLGVHVDITERIAAEETIKQANADLARSNEELAQFAYIASHDLQEPLRKVISFGKLLEEEAGSQLNDDSRVFLGYITDGARRMRTLIHDLLAFSRIESDGRQSKPCSSQAAARTALDNLELAIVDSQAKIVLDQLPTIVFDSRHLTQLFQNLIGNAIKYCDAKPEVHIGAQRVEDAWVFRVSDNGIGIAPEFREKTFGIFKRLHGRSSYPGNGIGLAICRRIVERGGGKIWIESNTPVGSVFAFSVPLNETSEKQQTEACDTVTAD